MWATRNLSSKIGNILLTSGGSSRHHRVEPLLTSIPVTLIFAFWAADSKVIMGQAFTEAPRRNKRSAYEKKKKMIMGLVSRPALGWGSSTRHFCTVAYATLTQGGTRIRRIAVGVSLWGQPGATQHGWNWDWSCWQRSEITMRITMITSQLSLTSITHVTPEAR